MKNDYLSKSDFKIAQTCAAKLYFKKHGYPTTVDNNEYMEMLADGGYMIGLMAQLLYPGGIEIGNAGGTARAIEETERLLQAHEEVTLFEPAIFINKQLVRIDILEKKGSVFNLIEVKSKSFDSLSWQEARLGKKKYFEAPGWRPYLEDIAFQKKTLQEKFPSSCIRCFLLMPDQAKRTEIDGLISWFEMVSSPGERNGFRKPEVRFTGSPGQLKALRKDHVLEWVNVDAEVEKIIPGISEPVKAYIRSIEQDQPIKVPLSCSCRDCEYRVSSATHPVSGFESCWGEKAHTSPHILELGQLGNVNRRTAYPNCINTLIQSGKSSLTDIPPEYVSKEDGTDFYNNRPYYQLTARREFLLPGFGEDIRHIRYPLHFIDFETSQMAVPYHAKMRPYDKVIFQWSCHSIERPGAAPVHTGWLNNCDAYPNFHFARSLKEQLGNQGTFMVWSSYENTQLKNIRESMEIRKEEDPALVGWLEQVASFGKDDDSLLLDMNKLAIKYYFHPLMGGRTSIKVVLPAVLQSCSSPRIAAWLDEAGLLNRDGEGRITNPYKLLPEPQPIVNGQTIKVKDGAGAMRAYQDMLYGLNRDNQGIKEIYCKALFEYCRLDTLAMVIIWEHWMQLHRVNTKTAS